MKILETTPITKGWSADRKFCVRAEGGARYLLRLSAEDLYERKQRQFQQMEQVAVLGIPMCRPVSFGVCSQGVYTLLEWIDGRDGEEVIPSMPASRQYALGLEAGRILGKIHTIPAPAGLEPWDIRFNRKIDRKIKMYETCPLHYEKGQLFLDYVRENRYILKDRPQVYQHGDYHIGNMMVDSQGNLVIIDFDRDDYGDPWEEFNRIVWCAQKAPAFASGMVDGYFDGEVPMEFWRLLCLYVSVNTLSSLPWAIPFGEGEIHTMEQQAGEILYWYGDFDRVVPKWYRSYE